MEVLWPVFGGGIAGVAVAALLISVVNRVVAQKLDEKNLAAEVRPGVTPMPQCLDVRPRAA